MNEPAPPVPRLAVVVVPFGGLDALRRCLERLRHQSVAAEMEVVVPCDERLESLDELRADFPEFRFAPRPGRRSWAEQRASGIRSTGAPVVALVEAQCLPARDWAERHLAAHASRRGAVGGVVDKKSGSPLAWALYFFDYGRYAPPLAEGAASTLTDCNVSYRRTVLDEVGEEWAHEFHENIVHQALGTLGAPGGALWLDPRILVEHVRAPSAREVLTDRWSFGRLFAATRVADLPASRRWLYAAASPLVPLLITGRATQQALVRRRHLRHLAIALPWMILLAAVWAGGELCGYLTGRAGRSLTPAMTPREGA